MSNIKSKLVMPLQEQAEALGFSTVQDAIDNGYYVVEDLETINATLEKLSIDEQYEQAHEAWVKEKEVILGYVYGAMGLIEALHNVGQYQREDQLKTLEQTYRELEKVCKFIEGVKHE